MIKEKPLVSICIPTYNREQFIVEAMDSNNQLMNYFDKDAIAVFEKNQDIGVVYGDAEYFGEKTGL
jgi:hypothetical protein